MRRTALLRPILLPLDAGSPKRSTATTTFCRLEPCLLPSRGCVGVIRFILHISGNEYAARNSSLGKYLRYERPSTLNYLINLRFFLNGTLLYEMPVNITTIITPKYKRPKFAISKEVQKHRFTNPGVNAHIIQKKSFFMRPNTEYCL